MAAWNIEIKWEKRLCKVNGSFGYFHTWEHYSRPNFPEEPDGIIGRVYGIVEFPDGKIKSVDPRDIIFCDDEAEYLKLINQEKKEI